MKFIKLVHSFVILSFFTLILSCKCKECKIIDSTGQIVNSEKFCGDELKAAEDSEFYDCD